MKNMFSWNLFCRIPIICFISISLLAINASCLGEDKISKPKEIEDIVLACLDDFFIKYWKTDDSKETYSIIFEFKINEYKEDKKNGCFFVEKSETENIPISNRIKEKLLNSGVRIREGAEESYPYFSICMRNDYNKEGLVLEIGLVEGGLSGRGIIYKWEIKNGRILVNFAGMVMY